MSLWGCLGSIVALMAQGGAKDSVEALLALASVELPSESVQVFRATEPGRRAVAIARGSGHALRFEDVPLGNVLLVWEMDRASGTPSVVRPTRPSGKVPEATRLRLFQATKAVCEHPTLVRWFARAVQFSIVEDGEGFSVGLTSLPQKVGERIYVRIGPTYKVERIVHGY